MRRAVFVALVAACVDNSGPRLDSVTPSAAGRGAQVTLSGARLCGELADCATAGGEIQIGLNPPVTIAIVIEYSETSALIEIPQITEVGRTSIVATVNEHASNALDFEVLP
jgi:hypothetical protein